MLNTCSIDFRWISGGGGKQPRANVPTPEMDGSHPVGDGEQAWENAKNRISGSRPAGGSGPSRVSVSKFMENGTQNIATTTRQ